MAKGVSNKISFKNYDQNQDVLIPLQLNELLDEKHPARSVSKMLDIIDLSSLNRTFKGGGASAYPPLMMLKIIIFAYLNNLYSSREIARACREQVAFMWLSAGNMPDFRTINNFRSNRLKGTIDEIFALIVKELATKGIISFETAYTDGTKMEASANRYKIVWRKNIERYKANREKKIREILHQINDVINNEKEHPETEEPLAELSAEEISEAAEQINNKLQNEKNRSRGERLKDIKKAETQLNRLKRHDIPKLFEYEESLQIMGNRNSYSKTDPDATGLRMKDDSLQAGYNIQLSTSDQFIINYSIHQEASDTSTFIPHLEKFYKLYGTYPQRESTDGAYGSLENYEYADSKAIEKHMKYGSFNKENKPKYKNDISKADNYYYNEEEDYFVCPMGQHMHRVDSNQERKTSNNYKYYVDEYQAVDCSRCTFKGACHKGKANKIIRVNQKLQKHKAVVRENLTCEEGERIRKQRNWDVETVFGQIKENSKFRRFKLRGTEKVNIEIGLLAIAHNIMKLNSILNSPNPLFFVYFYQKTKDPGILIFLIINFEIFNEKLQIFLLISKKRM